MSASQHKNQEIINADTFTPTGSGLYVPGAQPGTEASPAGAPHLDAETVAIISGNSAQAAVNGVLRAMQGGARRRSSGPRTQTQAQKDRITELNDSLADFSSTAAGSAVQPADLETVMPDGLTLIGKGGIDDPQHNIAPLPSDRTEAVAVHATNASSGLRLGPKLGVEFNSEHNAIDENNNYRRLRRRRNPDTGRTEFVDDGPAILELAKTVAGHQAATFAERRTREHIQHTSAEAMLSFDGVSRVANMLAPMINAKNMLSKRNVVHVVGPTRLGEIVSAKVYKADGTYVGPSTDPEVLKGRYSLVELAETNPPYPGKRLFDLNTAGKVRVFTKDGKYVGPTTDPEILKTLRGFDDLDVPVRTRLYLATDLKPAERRVTERQLRDFLKYAKEGSHALKESRHHIGPRVDDHDEPGLIRRAASVPGRAAKAVGRGTSRVAKAVVSPVTKPARALRENIADMRIEGLMREATLNRIESQLHTAGKDANGEDLPAGTDLTKLRDEKVAKARALTVKAVHRHAAAQTRRARR